GEADVVDYRTLQQLDLDRYAQLAASLIEHGIWVANRGVWYVSASHGPDELDAALTRFGKTLTDWA
ncbi:MAG: aspartate aminotransferase family protein, partial [Pseudonocardiaceae bacterium]|nr:aspartate aminotransferase family protein [Pseudonocardiaceae bacterium]